MNKRFTQAMIRLKKASAFEIGLIALVIAGLALGTLPSLASAQPAGQSPFADTAIAMEIAAMQNTLTPYGSLPLHEDRGPAYEMANIPVSAYNSLVAQTDATPCIGAAGTDICALLAAGSNTCAANFVPLGTVLEIEGLGTCTVRDRMNKRYTKRVDWYMGLDVSAARTWGVQYKTIGVYAS